MAKGPAKAPLNMDEHFVACWDTILKCCFNMEKHLVDTQISVSRTILDFKYNRKFRGYLEGLGIRFQVYPIYGHGRLICSGLCTEFVG